MVSAEQTTSYPKEYADTFGQTQFFNSMQQVACPARLYQICVRSEIRGFARPVGHVGWDG